MSLWTHILHYGGNHLQPVSQDQGRQVSSFEVLGDLDAGPLHWELLLPVLYLPVLHVATAEPEHLQVLHHAAKPECCHNYRDEGAEPDLVHKLQAEDAEPDLLHEVDQYDTGGLVDSSSLPSWFLSSSSPFPGPVVEVPLQAEARPLSLLLLLEFSALDLVDVVLVGICSRVLVLYHHELLHAGN